MSHDGNAVGQAPDQASTRPWSGPVTTIGQIPRRAHPPKRAASQITGHDHCHQHQPNTVTRPRYGYSQPDQSVKPKLLSVAVVAAPADRPGGPLSPIPGRFRTQDSVRGNLSPPRDGRLRGTQQQSHRPSTRRLRVGTTSRTARGPATARAATRHPDARRGMRAR